MDAILNHGPLQPQLPVNLASEAHHRIANSLSVLVGVVRMQSAGVKKTAHAYSNAEVRHVLDGIAARINTISQLHRMLSQSETHGAISLKPYLHDVTDALVAALSAPDREVRVVHTGSDCVVLTRQVQPIMLILCEIFINAMKFAHPSGVPLIMLVDCSVTPDGKLLLTVSDDGVGLPEGFDPSQSTGMGFRVMHSLAAEIGAELCIQSTHLGLSCRVALPASAMVGAKLA